MYAKPSIYPTHFYGDGDGYATPAHTNHFQIRTRIVLCSYTNKIMFVHE